MAVQNVNKGFVYITDFTASLMSHFLNKEYILHFIATIFECRSHIQNIKYLPVYSSGLKSRLQILSLFTFFAVLIFVCWHSQTIITSITCTPLNK